MGARHRTVLMCSMQLLVMDDRKKEFKVKKAKRAKRGEAVANEAAADVLDVDDQRFAALWSRPEYAIDKTDQRFKATQSMERLLGRVREKRERERDRSQIEQVSGHAW